MARRGRGRGRGRGARVTPYPATAVSTSVAAPSLVPLSGVSTTSSGVFLRPVVSPSRGGPVPGSTVATSSGVTASPPRSSPSVPAVSVTAAVPHPILSTASTGDATGLAQLTLDDLLSMVRRVVCEEHQQSVPSSASPATVGQQLVPTVSLVDAPPSVVAPAPGSVAGMYMCLLSARVCCLLGVGIRLFFYCCGCGTVGFVGLVCWL